MPREIPDGWIDLLSRGPLLQGVPEETLADLLRKLDERHWKAHQFLLTPDEGVRTFCVILNGRIKITRQNSQTGRELTLFLLGPGDGFNIVSLLDGHPHDVTATTLEPVRALCGPVELWQKWMAEHAEAVHAIRRYLDRQLKQLSELASDLALHDTMTRLAHLLLRNFEEEQQNPHRDLLRGLSHEELAHLIGTVRVVVNRLLRELKDQGVVDNQAGQLHIRNLQKLLRIAEGHLQESPA